MEVLYRNHFDTVMHSLCLSTTEGYHPGLSHLTNTELASVPPQRLIIPDQRNCEFIVTIYNVKDAEKLPVDLLTWTYEKEIPESGILLTSSPLDADLPETKVYTKAEISLQDRNDTIDLCFGPAGTSTIEIDSTAYDYSAWKIDKGVTIGYSSNEIEELENILKDYLKRKGENK